MKIIWFKCLTFFLYKYVIKLIIIEKKMFKLQFRVFFYFLNFCVISVQVFEKCLALENLSVVNNDFFLNPLCAAFSPLLWYKNAVRHIVSLFSGIIKKWYNKTYNQLEVMHRDSGFIDITESLFFLFRFLNVYIRLKKFTPTRLMANYASFDANCLLVDLHTSTRKK